MADITSAANLQTSATLEHEGNTVDLGATGAGAAHATDGGVDLAGSGAGSVSYTGEHGSATLGGAGELSGAASADGADLTGAGDLAGGVDVGDATGDLQGHLDAATSAAPDGGSVSFEGALDVVLQAMEDVWTNVSASLSAMLGA